MRIALFNWRDVRNPLAGGAEAYQHRLLGKLSGRGHTVAVFTSRFPGCLDEETIDGVRYVRYAGKFMIYPMARGCYLSRIRGRFDVVVDTMNGVPFFTNRFCQEKAVLLIYQLTRENWYSALPAPIAFMGYHLEEPMLRSYRGSPIIALSPSTAKDVEDCGLPSPMVLGGAGDIVPPDRIKKSEGSLICLGRLTRSKRIDHAIKAFAFISKQVPDSRLVIAGRGPEENRLKSLAKSLGLEGRISFEGYVDEERKAALLAGSELMMMPAVREGWGMGVSEANACRTPVLGYDVPGLRDSIEEGVNGHRIPDGRFDLMAAQAIALLGDRDRLATLSMRAQRHSRGHSWDDIADRFLEMLERS